MATLKVMGITAVVCLVAGFHGMVAGLLALLIAILLIGLQMFANPEKW